MMSPVLKSPCQHRKCSGRQIKMITFCVTEGAGSQSTSSCFHRETFVTSGTLLVAKSRQPGPGGCKAGCAALVMAEGRRGGYMLYPGCTGSSHGCRTLLCQSCPHDDIAPPIVPEVLCGWERLPLMSTCYGKSNSNQCLSIPLLKP